MSHCYSIKCQCGDEIGDWNHAGDDLVRAVEEAHALYVFRQTGGRWATDLSDLPFGGTLYEGLAAFIVEHYAHGGFSVCGEYQSDKPVPCRPKAPNGEYEAACLNKLGAEVKDLEGRLAELMRRLKPVSGGIEYGPP